MKTTFFSLFWNKLLIPHANCNGHVPFDMFHHIRPQNDTLGFFGRKYLSEQHWQMRHIRLHGCIYHSQRTTKPTIRSMCPADSDQPVNPSSMARFLVHSSLDSPEAVESTCGQRRLWSDWADGSCKEQQKPRSMRTRKYWSGHIWCAYKNHPS